MQHSLNASSVCSCEQRYARVRRTVPLMQLQQMNGAIAATWILAAGLIGVVGNVTSIGGGAIVLGCGLVPPILMMLRWRDPAQAVSVRVHQVKP
jgi:hypothetical protein